jgi:hypothetical protein
MGLLTNKTPLFLPEGSVRSVLALGVVGAYIAGAVDADTAILVLGFYFLTRK